MSFVADLTIPAGSVASTLTDFVVRVDLAHMPAGWWADVATDGSDIRVKDSVGTALPFDVTRFNAGTSTGELFFKATLTTGANAFTVEVVDGATAPAVTDPLGRNAVWSDYDVVFIGGGGLANRSGLTGDAALGGSATVTPDGWLDIPRSTHGYALFASLGVHRSAFTMGASVVPVVNDFHSCIVSYNHSPTSTPRTSLALRETGTWSTWNSSNSWLDTGVSYTAGTRARIVITQGSAAGRTIYRNGASIGSGTSATVPPTTSTNPSFLIGSSETDNTEDFDGALNYAYLRAGVLTADWLAAESESWETPSSFYTVSEPAAAITGTVTLTTPPPTVALAGAVAPAGITGTLTISVPAPALALTGGSAAADITGSLVLGAPVPTLTLAGTSDAPTVIGILAVNATAPIPTLTGTYSGPVFADTDLTYSSDGYGYDGIARVVYDPPVIESAAIARTKIKRVHQSLPPPTLVSGRPT